MKEVKIPGPEHPINIEPAQGYVQVFADGLVIAASVSALVLREADYPPVYYIPSFDVALDELERSEHQTYCPYKGDCTYFDIPASGAKGKNAVWSYEHPFEAVQPIMGYHAFYPDRVSVVFTKR